MDNVCNINLIYVLNTSYVYINLHLELLSLYEDTFENLKLNLGSSVF